MLRVVVVDGEGEIADPDHVFTIPGAPMASNRCFQPVLLPRAQGPKGYRASIGHTASYKRMRARFLAPAYQLRTPLLVVVDAYWPTRSNKWSTNEIVLANADADAVAKPLLDCLEHVGVIADDKIIQSLVLRKHYDKESPRTEVRIWDLRMRREGR